jgi:hypothetical protein
MISHGKAETIIFSGCGMQNCDINQKCNLSSSIVAAVRQAKYRIIETVKKAHPLLPTAKREHCGLAAKTENFPIFWASDRN